MFKMELIDKMNLFIFKNLYLSKKKILFLVLLGLNIFNIVDCIITYRVVYQQGGYEANLIPSLIISFAGYRIAIIYKFIITNLIVLVSFWLWLKYFKEKKDVGSLVNPPQ